ncbi:MAG: ATP-binding protein [Pseudomonadota bacterium]
MNKHVFMTRLFLSLYVFVALSIFSLGLGLETLLFSNESTKSPSQQAMQALLEANQSDEQALTTILTQSDAVFDRLERSQIEFINELGNSIKNNQLVYGMQNDKWTIYIPIVDGAVIVAQFPQTDAPSHAWSLYSLLFFGSLGVALAIWVFPIGRDLKRLKIAAQSPMKNGQIDIPSISAHSPLYPLANGYRVLNSNVKQLLSKHRILVGAVTHEFKTPIARLKFALVNSGHYSDANIAAIQSDVKDLENLVEEMLDFTRIESLESDLHIEDIPLVEFCRACVKRQLIPDALQIKVNGPDVTLSADAGFLARALENLITNAIRHAEKEIRLTIENKKEIVLYVEDDGAGVSDRDKSKVFEPFYRSDEHRSRGTGGTGLGLAIVQQVMLKHEGHCSVSDSKLGGARFNLHFPKYSYSNAKVSRT